MKYGSKYFPIFILVILLVLFFDSTIVWLIWSIHYQQMLIIMKWTNLKIRHTHISVRDGRSFSFHFNRKHLVWLSFDRPSQRHLHFNGIGTINNDVARFYFTIFNSNRANNIPSLISCSLPSIYSLNWNYFNRTNSFDLYQI